MPKPYHNTFEEPYLSLLESTLSAPTRVTRNGVTRAKFAGQMRFDLTQGFPLLTTKKVNFSLILAELLWFLEAGRKPDKERGEIHGRLSTKRLDEIYGDTSNIWDGDANNFREKGKALFDGDCGRIYGSQWRNWKAARHNTKEYSSEGGDFDYTVQKIIIDETDQVVDLIHKLKTDPTSRYMRVVAWNPGEVDSMALPACHAGFQCFVRTDEYDSAISRLDLHMEQRSCDMFLGVPFNIASYAILTHMLAQVSGLQVGELIITLQDYHSYEAHQEQIKLQLSRQPFTPPRLVLDKGVTDIDGFTMGNVRLEGYYSHPGIRAPLLTKNIKK